MSPYLEPTGPQELVGLRNLLAPYMGSRWHERAEGYYVRCAKSGELIHLPDLLYWSVERQESYAGPPELLVKIEDRDE